MSCENELQNYTSPPDQYKHRLSCSFYCKWGQTWCRAICQQAEMQKKRKKKKLELEDNLLKPASPGFLNQRTNPFPAILCISYLPLPVPFFWACQFVCSIDWWMTVNKRFHPQVSWAPVPLSACYYLLCNLAVLSVCHSGRGSQAKDSFLSEIISKVVFPWL